MDDGVRIVDAVATPTAVVAETTTWAAFPQVWGALLGEVWGFLRGSELTTGRNVMLYKDDEPSVEVGVEVNAPFPATVRVVPSSLPGGRAAMTVARGAPSPEGLAQAHAAVHAWCATNGHALTGVRFEVYGHWLEDQDPALYEIEVYWLIA